MFNLWGFREAVLGAGHSAGHVERKREGTAEGEGKDGHLDEESKSTKRTVMSSVRALNSGPSGASTVHQP